MSILAIDGNSIMNRAYFGIKGLTTKEGLHTNAVYGFLNTMLTISKAYNPDKIFVAFDLPKPTFRHLKYNGYKAGRRTPEEDFIEQFPYIKSVLGYMGIPIIEKEGFEADDILGTLSVSGDMVYILTGDRDSFQLISDKCHILYCGQKGNIEYDKDRLFEEYGLTPDEMITLKALMGDSSDNIPGAKGVGPATATPLVQAYHTVDGIYEHIDEIKPTVQKKLIASKDDVYMSLELGTIIKNVPFETPEAEKNETELRKILTKLELKKILDRLKLQVLIEKTATENKTDSDVCVEIPENVLVVSSLPISDFAGKKIITDCSKQIYAYCENENIEPPEIIFDTSLAAYLINPDLEDYSTEALCIEYGISDENEIISLYNILKKKIIDINAENLLKMEIRLSCVLASMENIGVAVDKDGISAFGEMLTGKINELQNQIYFTTGFEFNLNSPKQLGEVLFEKMCIPCKKKTKTGYSTSADVLEELAPDYPVIADIIEYRTLTKLKSTYCDGLLKVIGSDGRIHSTFNQTETRTGRISSSEPNLQNIPVRTDLGAEMRKFFIAKNGWTLTDADYSQIELRVLAAISGDENMIEAFRNGTDIHTATAAKVFGMPEDFVTPQMRSRAKAVNFGIVYGIGAFSLSKDIDVSVREAKKYIDDYLSTFSGVRQYMEDTLNDAKRTGFVSTIYGRRRYLPELKSSNAIQRKFGERVARNSPIQGSAADIIKIAMINVHKRLKTEGLQSRLILQIHDELIIETAPGEEKAVESLLKEEMENAVNLGVDLTVDIHNGNTWYSV